MFCGFFVFGFGFCYMGGVSAGPDGGTRRGLAGRKCQGRLRKTAELGAGRCHSDGSSQSQRKPDLWDLRNSTGVAGEAWDEEQRGAPRTSGRSAHTLALHKESASCHMVSKPRPSWMKFGNSR